MTAGERPIARALAVLAGLNLALAVFVIATQPERARDLNTMYDWCRQWLSGRVDLYRLPDAATDYPPNAIVLFSPLALLPARWLVPAWTICSLALALLLPFVVVRTARSDRRWRTSTAIAVAAFLCWASARTLLQFSVLSMTLAFSALWLEDAAPVASGICLGLALVKPHIALPVALWAVVSGRWRNVATASMVVAAGVLAYCAYADASPFETIPAYWRVLAATYSGADGLVGVTSVRRWAASDAAWIAVAAALLTLLIAMAWTSRRATGLDRLAVVACGCLWSLLAFYHNGNNLILVLPAFVVMLAGAPLAALAAVQLALMIDVPARLGGLVPPRGVLHTLVIDFDRLLVLAMLGAMVLFWWRHPPAVDKIDASPKGA